MLHQKDNMEIKLTSTSVKHAKVYGLECKKPAFVENINLVDKDSIETLEKSCMANNYDVIFGNIPNDCNIEEVKELLKTKGFELCEGNNDFYKKINR